jgi:hypothetical protein
MLANIGRKIADFSSTKAGLATIAGVAGTAGMASGIGSSAKEAAFDVAFNDPYADKAFVGTSLSGRFLLGSAMGGPMGGLMQASSPLSYATVNPPLTGNPMASASAGAGIVGGIGAAIGSTRGKRGAFIGAAIGAVAGGVGLPVAATGRYVASNRDFFTQSPYANRSSTTAAALNASGDIVLGMHNSRGGY